MVYYCHCKLFIIISIAILLWIENLCKCEPTDIFLNSNFTFALKPTQNAIATKTFYLFNLQQTNTVEVNAFYNYTNDEVFVSQTKSIQLNYTNATTLTDLLRIQANLIDGHYSTTQTAIRIAFISKNRVEDVIEPNKHNSVCAVIFTYEREVFLYKTCFFHHDTKSDALLCYTILNLNKNESILKFKNNLSLYYKLLDNFTETECDSLSSNDIHEQFALLKYNADNFQYLGDISYLDSIVYNKKYSNLIMISPQIPFNIYIPKIEYRIDNRFFIFCEFSYENLLSSFTTFNISVKTNEMIDVKSIRIEINKYIFNFEYLLVNEKNLQINIERLVNLNKHVNDVIMNDDELNEENDSKEANDDGESSELLKKIQIYIECSIVNNLSNGVITWNLDLNSQRSFTMNTTLNIQHTNLIKIIPIVETNELVNTAVISGATTKYPLKIYALYTNNSLVYITDHTRQSQCTANTTQLKVKQNCEYVYFDGTEIADKQQTQIQIKFKQKIEYLQLKIYQPEFPLQLESIQNELHGIKDWYYPSIKLTKRQTNDEELNDLKYYMNTIEDYETAVDDYTVEYDQRETNLKKFCKNQYQIMPVNVYARFYSINRFGFKEYVLGDSNNETIEKVRENSLLFDVGSLATLKVDSEEYAYIIDKNYLIPKKSGRIYVKVIAPNLNVTIGETGINLISDPKNLTNIQINAINDVKLNAKQTTQRQIEVSVSSSINYNNNQTTHIDYANQNFSTKILLNLQLEFENNLKIPLSHYSSSLFAINITQVPFETNRLKPSEIRITYKTQPEIHFLFNSVNKHFFQDEYKFQLEFYTFKKNCLSSLTENSKNLNDMTDVLQSLKPTQLLLTKIFKIKFEREFEFYTIVSQIKTSKASQANTVAISTTSSVPVNLPSTTKYPFLIELTDDDAHLILDTTPYSDVIIERSLDKHSILKILFNFLIGLFLIILFIFFINLFLINRKNRKLLKFKNQLYLSSTNTDLSSSTPMHTTIRTTTGDNHSSSNNSSNNATSSETQLINFDNRTLTPVLGTTANNTVTNSLKNFKPILRKNIAKKIRSRLNTQSLTNEIVANGEFDFVLMTHESRFMNRYNSVDKSDELKIEKCENDLIFANKNTQSVQQPLHCLTQQRRTTIQYPFPQQYKQQQSHKPAPFQPHMRTPTNRSRNNYNNFNRWSTPYNMLLMPSSTERRSTGVHLHNHVAEFDKRRVSQIYEEMANYFDNLKESSA